MASRHFLRRIGAVRRPLITPPLISSVRELSGISGYFRDLKAKFTGMWEIKQEIQEEKSTQIHKNSREEFARVYKKWDDVYKDLKQYEMDKELEERVRNVDVNFKSLGRKFEEGKCPNEVADKLQHAAENNGRKKVNAKMK